MPEKEQRTAPATRPLLASPPIPRVLVESERLQCRRAHDSDRELMKALFQDPAMTKFLGGPASDEKLERWLTNWQAGWDTGESFCGIMAKRGCDAGIGSASIHPSCVPGEEGAEISYMVLPEHQRQGFATEMSQALVRFAFESMRLPRLLIATSPENEISNAIARRLGFQPQKDRSFVHPEWPNHAHHAVWILEQIAWKE